MNFVNPGAGFDGFDRGRGVVEKVVAEIPVVVVRVGNRARALFGFFALQAQIAETVAPQLQNMNVGDEVEHVFDELAGGPGKAILAEAVDEQQGLPEQRLMPHLRHRLIAGDHQRPAVFGHDFVVRDRV